MLTRLRQWLEQWPGWKEKESICVDQLGVLGGAVSLRPGGVDELGRSSNILGGAWLHLRYTFLLDLRMEKSPGDVLGAENNAAFLLALQDWVNAESAAGRAPCMGGENEKIRAKKGHLQQADADGAAIYRLELTVEQEKQYEREYYGEN